MKPPHQEWANRGARWQFVCNETQHPTKPPHQERANRGARNGQIVRPDGTLSAVKPNTLRNLLTRNGQIAGPGSAQSQEHSIVFLHEVFGQHVLAHLHLHPELDTLLLQQVHSSLDNLWGESQGLGVSVMNHYVFEGMLVLGVELIALH